jgi:hypothetical protein
MWESIRDWIIADYMMPGSCLPCVIDKQQNVSILRNEGFFAPY